MPDPPPSNVPVEIIYHIFENLAPSSLASAAQANSSLQVVSEKFIYKHLQLTSIQQATQCCQTLLAKPAIAQSVRHFTLLLDRVQPKDIHPVFPAMLASALQVLPNLTALHLGIQGPFLPVLRHCNYPHLTAFSSILDLHASCSTLVDFLTRHPTITHLCMGGDSIVDLRGNPLLLPNHALPRLNTYIGSRRLVPFLVPRRPVTSLSLAWNTDDLNKEADCFLPLIAKSTAVVTSFSVCTTGWSVYMLHRISGYLTSLQTLRLHNLSVENHNEGALLRELTEVLPRFTDLHTLELPCRISPGRPSSLLTKETEAALLVRWTYQQPSSTTHRRGPPPNPKLSCVRLPSGRTWQRRKTGANGAWSGWSLVLN